MLAAEHQRSVGRASVVFTRRNGVTAVSALAQSGSARTIPSRPGPGRPEIVFLNTSGGLASGDVLSTAVTLERGATARATTQTAERAYLCLDGPALADIRLTAGADARLDWLPQETILFEGSHLVRRTEVDLGAGAAFLMCETVVLGRRAMGEAPVRARLSDRRRVRRAGRLVWAEDQRLDQGILACAGSQAMLGGHVAFGVLAFFAPGADAAAAGLRDVPALPGVELGVSGWDGKALVRLVAPDAWPLKLTLARMIALLGQADLPKTWQLQGFAA